MTIGHAVIKESHPDWQVFKNEAKKGVLFTNFAYEQTDKEMYALADRLPENYELLLMTDHNEGTKDASFRCAVFINRQTKEVVCATAGTRPGLNRNGFDDLVDDARLGLKKQPYKMKAARNLNDQILGSLGEESKDYKFTYTGHSLGAAMAEMQAADMDIQLTANGIKKDKEQITAITFENPGTKVILQDMYKSAGIELDNIQDRMNMCEFNNRKNIINNAADQAGRTYTIIPHSQADKNLSTIQMICEIIIRKFAELSSIIEEAFTLLAPGGIGTNFVDDHGMSKFDEMFVQEQGDILRKDKVISMEQAYSGIKPVQYNEELVDIIREIRKEANTHKDGIQIGMPEFSMSGMKAKNSQFENATKEKGDLDRIIFSAEEAKLAIAQMKRQDKDRSYAGAMKKHCVKQYLKKASNNALPTIEKALEKEVQR